MNIRNIEKHIRFNAEEWEIVKRRADLLNVSPGRYIRMIAVQGTIKHYDTKQLNNVLLAFHRIGSELNQVAKVANSTKSVYQKDIEDLQKKFKELETVICNYLTPLRCEELLKGE